MDQLTEALADPGTVAEKLSESPCVTIAFDGEMAREGEDWLELAEDAELDKEDGSFVETSPQAVNKGKARQRAIPIDGWQGRRSSCDLMAKPPPNRLPAGRSNRFLRKPTSHAGRLETMDAAAFKHEMFML